MITPWRTCVLLATSVISLVLTAVVSVGVAAGATSTSPKVAVTCVGRTAVVDGPARVDRALGIIQPQVPDDDVACGQGPSSMPVSAPLGAVGASTRYNGGAPPLLSHQGITMGTASSPGATTITPIFWTPLIKHAPLSYGFPSNYESSLDGLTADLASSSGKPSTVLGELTQYTNASGAHLSNQITAGSALTSSAAPSTNVARCTPDTGHIYNDQSGYVACVTDAQIAAEGTAVVEAAQLPMDGSHLYAVFLPEGIEVCYGSANGTEGGTCTPNHGVTASGFCAYHADAAQLVSGQISGQISGLIYAAMPYSVWDSRTGLDCNGSDTFPQGDPPVDVIASSYVHEVAEAITDPVGEGWIDRRGNEIGDLCAYTYGPTSSTSTGARYSQVLGGQDFEIQQLFSNASYAKNQATGCQSSWSIPTVTLKSAGKAKVGVPTTFTASVATPSGGVMARSWEINGQVVGSGASLTYTFENAGTAQVTLTVTDTGTYQATSNIESVSVTKK